MKRVKGKFSSLVFMAELVLIAALQSVLPAPLAKPDIMVCWCTTAACDDDTNVTG